MADAVYKHEEQKMARLTDTQLMVLSKAAAREDGLATVPDGLNKAAASKVGASLVSRKLMRELRSKAGMPVWREDEEGRGTSLVITRGGREAIGVEQDQDSSSQGPRAAKNDGAGANHRKRCPVTRAGNIDEPRAGSKQALLIKMLSRKSGATVEGLVDATGWLPHTTRAALTGLRKRGYAVVLERQEGKPSVYHITVGHDRAAA
jgi:hypothetical protein